MIENGVRRCVHPGFARPQIGEDRLPFAEVAQGRGATDDDAAVLRTGEGGGAGVERGDGGGGIGGMVAVVEEARQITDSTKDLRQIPFAEWTKAGGVVSFT